ncbi:PH domain-containing protein [Rubripirellula sp.]|nr:PH domain-containing protein [Rubripirellula sp.]
MNDKSTNRDTPVNEDLGLPHGSKANESSDQDASSEEASSEEASSEEASSEEASDQSLPPQTSLMASAASLAETDPSDITEVNSVQRDGVRMSLDVRWIWLGRMIGMVLLGVVAVLSVSSTYRIYLSIPVPQNLFVPFVWVVLLVLGAGLAWIIPLQRYRHWSYQLGDQVLVICHGVISRVVVAIPLSRLQHVDLHDGPITRRFGLSSLEIHTAGTRAASQVIPGLSHQTARELRDQLIVAANRDADVITRD